MYNFGQAFTRYFYPTDGDLPINLPTQTPHIYVFDSQPSREHAADGTGAIQTITTWTEVTITPYKRSFTVAAIADPEPTSSTYTREYWLAINFVTVAAGQTQTVVRSFEVSRVEGTESLPETTVRDVQDVYPQITSYLSPNELGEFIAIAESHVRTQLEAKGVSWPHVRDLKKLKSAIAYKAIWFSALSQVKAAGDKFTVRMAEYAKLYDFIMDSIKLPVDLDKDGDPDAIAATSNFAWFSSK